MVSYTLKFGKEDYQKPRRVETLPDGTKRHLISISISVPGMMRQVEELIKSGRFKHENLHFILEEYSKLYLLAQAGVKEYPMPPRKKRGD